MTHMILIITFLLAERLRKSSRFLDIWQFDEGTGSAGNCHTEGSAQVDKEGVMKSTVTAELRHIDKHLDLDTQEDRWRESGVIAESARAPHGLTASLA